jgi:16S rRNA (uracil1498-N3)-methyltransferase
VAVIEKVARSSLELTVLSRSQVDRELPLLVSLGVALPKGDRQKWLVEKLVELGVNRLIPLETARSVSQAGPQVLDRLRRTVVEASKQCGRNRLMEIVPPQSWNDFVAQSGGAACRLLAHPQDRNQPTAGLPLGHSPKSACLAVGPEGGLTADEVDLAAAAGWQLVDLGPRILRVETAATLLVALVVQASLARG